MKFVAVFTLLMAVQASASIFDTFSNAFVKVENGFGKVLDNVVADVKVTIDCTISAVENALSLGGMFKGHSEYERRCKGENGNYQPAPVQNTGFIAPKPIYDSVTAPSTKREKQSVKREVKSSMATVEDTIKGIIDQPRSLDGLESVKTVLKEDTTKLGNVGLSLTKQLDDITSSVKNEVEKNGDSASTVDDMLDKINVLHKVTDQKSDAEDSQIRLAYDEVMDAIHSNSTTVHLANDHTAKEIMNDLEKTSHNTFTDIETTYSQFRNEENKHLNNLEDIVKSRSQDLVKNKSKDSENEIPISFKTLAQQIMNETPNTVVKNTIETTVKSATEAPTPSTVIPSKDKSEPLEDPEVLMFNAYFGSNYGDAEESDDEAMSFIQRSKYSQMLISKVSSSDAAVNVFDKPELLNYR